MKKPEFIWLQAAELKKRLKEPRQCIQVLSRARQTGKTTLARQVAERSKMPCHYTKMMSEVNSIFG